MFDSIKKGFTQEIANPKATQEKHKKQTRGNTKARQIENTRQQGNNNAHKTSHKKENKKKRIGKHHKVKH